MEFKQDIAPLPPTSAFDHARRVEEELRRLTWLTWILKGSIIIKTEDITSAKTLTDDNSFIKATEGADITINLPDPFDSKGKVFYIKKMEAAGEVDIDCSSNIDDVTRLAITDQYYCVAVLADGTRWLRIADYSTK